jgi:hypothetical protein
MEYDSNRGTRDPDRPHELGNSGSFPLSTTPIVAVVGATAAGKTSLSLDLAETLGGEIINTDAMQVYRGMDIGTAKPTAAELAAVPHHLVDIYAIDRTATVAEFQELYAYPENDAGEEAVAVLDHRVVLERRHRAAVALRPVGAAKSGADSTHKSSYKYEYNGGNNRGNRQLLISVQIHIKFTWVIDIL